MTTHPFYTIQCPDKKGSLFLTPCPGTKEVDLNTSITQFNQAGATAIITLMLEQEIYDNNISEMNALCEEQDMQWFHFPIVDEGVPEEEFDQLWEKYKSEIHAILNDNESIVIHCKGGSGRTGIVAAKILLERGADFEKTIKEIKALRPNAFGHDVQVEYMEQYR